MAKMSEIDWRRVHNGKILHGFVGAWLEADNSPRAFPPTVKMRQTLCGKWFANYHDDTDNHFYRKCKKCLGVEAIFNG